MTRFITEAAPELLAAVQRTEQRMACGYVLMISDSLISAARLLDTAFVQRYVSLLCSVTASL